MKNAQRAVASRWIKLVAATCGFAAIGALGATVGMGQTAAAPSIPTQMGGMTLGATATVSTPPTAPATSFAAPAVKATPK